MAQGDVYDAFYNMVHDLEKHEGDQNEDEAVHVYTPYDDGDGDMTGRDVVINAADSLSGHVINR